MFLKVFHWIFNFLSLLFIKNNSLVVEFMLCNFLQIILKNYLNFKVQLFSMFITINYFYFKYLFFLIILLDCNLFLKMLNIFCVFRNLFLFFIIHYLVLILRLAHYYSNDAMSVIMAY